MTDTAGRATGSDIIQAIVEQMYDNLEPLATEVLAPSLYQVYLHERDHERLKAIFPRLEADARKALDNEVTRLNRQAQPWYARLLGRLRGQSTYRPARTYAPADGEWFIQFGTDPEEQIAPGEVRVVPDLAVGSEERFSSGNKTHKVGGRTRNLKESTGRPRAAESLQPTLATFRYVDEAGPHSYEMKKTEIVIGRRASDAVTDIVLDTRSDVSREHAYVRYTGGRFFIQDVSDYGTKVNGKPIRRSRSEAGSNLGLWDPLLDGSIIELAEVIALEFKVAG